MKHAIISIHPEHVAAIISGSKKVEIRNRRVLLQPKSHLWIYSTLPVGAIEIVTEVAGTYHSSPTRAWANFERSIGLTRSEYRAYVNGSDLVSVIRLRKVMRLSKPLLLTDLRRSDRRFHPPQFFKSLDEDEAIYRLLAKTKPALFI